MKPVWIVDDDRSIRWVIEKALSREGIAYNSFSSAQEALDALAGAMPEVLGYLDTLSGDPFLAGPALSVADVAVVSNLVTMQYIGFALERGRFPRLAHLFDRAIRIPAMAEALRDEQPVVQQMGLRSDFLNAVLN